MEDTAIKIAEESIMTEEGMVSGFGATIGGVFHAWGITEDVAKDRVVRLSKGERLRIILGKNGDWK